MIENIKQNIKRLLPGTISVSKLSVTKQSFNVKKNEPIVKNNNVVFNHNICF